MKKESGFVLRTQKGQVMFKLPHHIMINAVSFVNGDMFNSGQPLCEFVSQITGKSCKIFFE